MVLRRVLQAGRVPLTRLALKTCSTLLNTTWPSASLGKSPQVAAGNLAATPTQQLWQNKPQRVDGISATCQIMSNDVFHFGDYELNGSERRLRRGGKRVALEPKALDLLLYLARHRDRAVDKEELQDTIWTGTIVTETSLTRAVMKARREAGARGSPESAPRKPATAALPWPRPACGHWARPDYSRQSSSH